MNKFKGGFGTQLVSQSYYKTFSTLPRKHVERVLLFLKKRFHHRVFGGHIWIFLRIKQPILLLCLRLKHNALQLPCYICFLLSPRLFQNIGKFGAKKYFTEQWKSNTIQSAVAIKESFLVHSISEQVFPQTEIPQRLVDICSHLFFCTLIK